MEAYSVKKRKEKKNVWRRFEKEKKDCSYLFTVNHAFSNVDVPISYKSSTSLHFILWTVIHTAISFLDFAQCLLNPFQSDCIRELLTSAFPICIWVGRYVPYKMACLLFLFLSFLSLKIYSFHNDPPRKMLFLTFNVYISSRWSARELTFSEVFGHRNEENKKNFKTQLYKKVALTHILLEFTFSALLYSSQNYEIENMTSWWK